MLYIIYFLVAFLATLIGSMIGLGGGIIIKPVLDNISAYSVDQIGFLSACTVLAMAIVTTAINKKNKLNPFVKDSWFLIIGSVIGGFVGSSLFNILLAHLNNSDKVTNVQAICLIIMLLFVIGINYINFELSVKKTN